MILNLKNENRNRILVLVVSFLTLFISFKSSNQWSDLPIGNDLFWWVIQIIFIIILLQLKKSYTFTQIDKIFLFVKLYLYWNVVCIVRGIFVAENYWEWKALLSTSFFLLLPLLVYTVNSSQSIQSIVKTWFRYALFIYILFSPFIWGDGVGKFLIPFGFLLLFFPILNLKWRIIVLVVTLYVITFDITARSNVIKFTIPLVIGLMFYFRKILSIKVLNVSRLLLLFAPFLLFFLAISGVFNVFKADEYVGDYNAKSDSHYDGPGEESLTADSRTFLYIEVIESAIKHDYVLFGRTPARGNDSASFGEFTKLTLNTGKQERFSNEVSILNIFTWLGLVGVLLYFLVFFKATYLAINRSNSIFIKLIGINIAFRWAYSFVEDFSEFDLSNIFLWIMIGMCFSESFRKMNDMEIKMWVRGIFEKKKTTPRKIINSSPNFQHKPL
jgi:hypothetical protein